MTNETLAEALPKEITRVRKILGYYNELGPVGMFGAAMIQYTLTAAEKAIMEGDVVEMLRVFKDLQDIEA